ncbi:endonuclease/exonuclease/phosphatase family protein [Cellulosilyticum ruminicola]|uniref:endonuclease/exonuclease/phosphatase family protein n=1 Tax=Cellulosilyticum ruminicola TaxID=425254 RepID=UPI0006D0B578|nr:endonuclease/exonuclease/phosphatase family protein [Cellulosilyticum ruminicola]
MKILTLNAHAWREENGEAKLSHLAETIIEKDYDIIAFQEVNQMIQIESVAPSCLTKEAVRAEFINGDFLADGVTRYNNYVAILLEKINALGGPQYYYFWDKAKSLRETYEEGCGILSKYPFKETEAFLVSGVTDCLSPKRRTIVRGTIEYQGELIDLYSCHLGWWHDEIDPAKPQIDKLMAKVNKDRLSFLMGDFNNNAHIRNEGYDYLIGKGLEDTYTLAEEKDEGATVEGEIAGWDGNKESLRIDLILMNKVLNVKTSRVIFNGQYKEVISDHYGVEAEIEL